MERAGKEMRGKLGKRMHKVQREREREREREWNMRNENSKWRLVFLRYNEGGSFFFLVFFSSYI